MLSKRLKAIASLIDNNNVIDIGCDHAFLDIYLTLQGKNTVALDNKESVLKGARENIKKHNLTDKIKVVLSNGLDNYKINKNETVVIAGMGTRTIIDILKNEQFKDINTLIIQSNNDLDKLRRYISSIGYYIENEIVVFEKKYYIIMKFKKGFKKYKRLEYKYGPFAIKNKEYLNYNINKLMELYNKVPKKNLFKRLRLKKMIKELRNIS